MSGECQVKVWRMLGKFQLDIGTISEIISHEFWSIFRLLFGFVKNGLNSNINERKLKKVGESKFFFGGE
jgi:hypothetical protein